MAVFLFLAYVVGYVLVLPISFIDVLKRYHKHLGEAARKRESVAPSLPDNANSDYSEAEVGKHMLTGITTHGMIFATPGLADRLSLVHSDAAFHLATGCALLIAAVFPGDNLRWLEAVVGFMMLCVGIDRGRKFMETYIQHVGIGLASQLASMTPQQIQVWTATVNALRMGAQAPQEQPAKPIEQPSIEQPRAPKAQGFLAPGEHSAGE